jgi:hypothetical protein
VNGRPNRIHAGALALLALCAAAHASPSNQPDEEGALKAAIILNLLRYSSWPERAPAGAPITVGILGRASFAGALRPALEGKSIDNRPIRVIEIAAPVDPRCCQAIILGLDKSADLKQILAALRGARVLTIGEVDRFLEYGGAVNLLEVDGHMSFEVSIEALDRSGVEISAKLLRFGQVKGRRSQ